MAGRFAGSHPLVSFTYFFSVLLCSMFFMHPVCLLLSFAGAFSYNLCLQGKKTVSFLLKVLVPMMLAAIVLNPLLNHQGVTVFLYINDAPVTLESVWYGIAAGAMFSSVMLWFSAFHVVMTSDKLLYLFGRLSPVVSLLFSMTLRFVPRYREQAGVIAQGQKCLGRDMTQGSVIQRVKNAGAILSILTTWALENGMETADAMRARGFGLKGRTHYSAYRFDRRAGLTLFTVAVLLLSAGTGAVLGANRAAYFPMFTAREMDARSILLYICYGLFCFLPVLLEGMEVLRWRRLQSTI